MGATASSSQRDGGCAEDAAAEELTAAASDARDEEEGSADDKLLQKNGQISSLNVKTQNHADELDGNFEERVLADAGSGFVTLKEDGTETIEDLQEMDALQPVMKNESTEMVNAEETMEDNQVNDINDIGFKKIFRFVGLKFTLKKDTCEKTEANEPEEKVRCALEDTSDIQENSAVAANENTPDETQKSELSSQIDSAEPSQQTENIKELDKDLKTLEDHVEDTPEKELSKEASPESEEPMSPIKQFFTQGIFASLRKKKKEEEMQMESKEEELKRIEKMGVEEAEKEDSKCMCLDIHYITSQEEKDSQEKDNDELLPEGELQNSLEKDKVQGSPLKRLFRKFSTRRQRESKAAEKVMEAEEQVSEQPKPSSELIELAKVEEPKTAEEELVADVSPLESKKKSDITVSWEALICGGSAKKRARKTNEDEKSDKGEGYEKTTDSPLGSSIEGDYDHLTSSNEQTGSPAEGEMGSTWKTLKKMVTPKRKVRAGESSTPEQIPSDSEMSKDESFSMKKLIPGHKKRKSDARKDQTSSHEGAKDHETGDEDDETPAIIPLSEYEIIEPESLKEVNEQRVEITIEHEMPEMTSHVLEQDTSTNLVPKIAVKVPANTEPTVVHVLSEDFEELADFLSKHQQLSDIPEEGINEESIETPVSSDEWTTQVDTLAEDIVELTADAVTAPEPTSEQITGDDTTEMVSAVSQLTESPRSSGHVTPVSAEYGVQTSDVILQEAIQSICMTPSVQSVTTKDESQESLAVSFSPYIVQSSTTEETKVLVAHKKTEATAICTGLVSQEIESVEEHLPVPLMEATLEVSDAVSTELVSHNFTGETETAGLGTDVVYKAEIKELKTEYLKVIVNEKEEPLVEESKETHIEDKKEEHTASIECRMVTEMMQSEDTHDPETECPLHSVLDEPVYEGQVAAEPEKQLTPLDVELSAAEFERAAPTEVVASLTHGDVENDPDTTTSKEVKAIEIIASAVECLETKETVSIVSQISDHIQSETLDLEESLKFEAVESVVDVCETKVEVKDAVLLAGDSAVTVEDISEKTEENDYEKMAQLDIKEIHVEEETVDAVASDIVENIEVENMSEAVDELLAREELPAKEVSLPESTLVEELHKEDTDRNLDDKKVKDRMDGIFEKKDEEHGVKEGQTLTNTESNETENADVFVHANTTDESPEIIVDAGSENGYMVQKIRECTVVPDCSTDISESTETPAKLEAISEVILKPLEMVLPEVEAKPLATEIVVSQTGDWSLDTKPSTEIPKENAQPATTENIKTGKVLEMVAIIENTSKHSGIEKSVESEPVTQFLEIAKLPKATEQEGEAIDGDQAPATTSSEMKEMAVTDKRDELAVAPKSEPEGFDSEQTMIEVAAITVLAQNYTATEIEVSNMIEQNNAADENARLKCEPLEQVTEMKSNELQVDKTEIKDEIPEVTEIAQVSPLTSEVTSEKPEVAVSEIQTEVACELRAETLEVTEPKVEIPVVTEVKVETVATELKVETPVVTSLFTELELETPEVTSIVRTTENLTSAMSQNQNIDTDASMLTTVIKEQVVEIPTVVSVVVTPATPLDETPDVTLGNDSKDVPPVKDTPSVTVEAVETANVGSVIVRTAVAPVVEIQNVIPVVATPDLGSVIVTEAASPVISTATVTTVAEATVVSTVVETPVFSVTAVKSTPAVVEIPATVTSVLQTPAVVSVAEIPEEVTLDVTPLVETPVNQEIEETIISITSIKPTVPAVTKTPVTEIPAMISVPEAVSPVVVTSAGIPVEPETIMIPEVETSEVTSTVEISLVTPVVQTPAQISIIVKDAGPPVTPPATAASETSAVIPSVMVTEIAPPVVVSEVAATVETPVVIPLVETTVVKPVPIAVVETPVLTPAVKTPGQVSVMVTESAPPVAVSAVATTVETTPVVNPVVETPVLKPEIDAVVETPVLIPAVQTPGQVSVMVTETVPPVAVSAVAATVESTPVVIPIVENPVVKPAPVAVVETPAVQTQGEVSVMGTEIAPPVVFSAVAAPIETPVLIPVVESPVGKPAPVAVVDTPVMTPVEQTPSQVSMAVTEATPPVVVSAVTAAAETPVVIPVVETPTQVVVEETQVVTQVRMTPTVIPITERSVVSQVIESAAESSAAISMEEKPVMIQGVQTPALVSVIAKEAALPVILPAVTTGAETSVVSPTVKVNPPVEVAETPVPVPEAPSVIPAVHTPVAEQVAQKPTTALPLLKATSVVTGMEAPAVAPLMMTPAITPVVAPPVLTPEVNKAMLQVIEEEKKEAKSEASLVSKNIEPPFVVAEEVKTSVLTEECASDEENRKASLQHMPVVTSTEPQSEIEEDVWEDAVDNIGDSPCQVTYTEGAPQDTAAKQTSDAAINSAS